MDCPDEVSPTYLLKGVVVKAEIHNIFVCDDVKEI